MISNRDASRQFFYLVWKKHRQGLILEPLESLILSIIQQHPEYHDVLNDEENRNNDFLSDPGAHNPFLHMGLHIAIQEQISTDRPPGIASLYRTMLGKYPDEHRLQHKLMGCLEQALCSAQEDGRAPDEQAYLESLRALA